MENENREAYGVCLVLQSQTAGERVRIYTDLPNLTSVNRPEHLGQLGLTVFILQESKLSQDVRKINLFWQLMSNI